MKGEHPPKIGSDHASLFLTMNTKELFSIWPFKFLAFWVEYDTLKNVINQHWDTIERGNNF